MMIVCVVVNVEEDDIVAVQVVAAGGIAAAVLVVFEIDTLYVVVQTETAQLAQVQVIEVVNGDLYAYDYYY